MSNRNSNAGTAADSSTTDEVTTSAKLLPNPLLSDALSNRLIAEFVGWRFEKSETNTITAFFENDKRWIDDERFLNSILTSKNGFAYNSDWNKFMPAFKKFRKLTGMKMPDWLIHTNNIENWIVRVNLPDANRCLVDAIKWYNQQGVSEGIR